MAFQNLNTILFFSLPVGREWGTVDSSSITTVTARKTHVILKRRKKWAFVLFVASKMMKNIWFGFFCQ